MLLFGFPPFTASGCVSGVFGSFCSLIVSLSLIGISVFFEGKQHFYNEYITNILVKMSVTTYKKVLHI
jgi:hypothetical protein